MGSKNIGIGSIQCLYIGLHLVQIVNIGSDSVNLKILVSGLTQTINYLSSSMTILTSDNVMDENSFLNPTKVKYSLTLTDGLMIVY